MKDAPLIRAVARGDYAGWRSLWDGYNEFYGRHGADALPEPITAATWERFFPPKEPVHALVDAVYAAARAADSTPRGLGASFDGLCFREGGEQYLQLRDRIICVRRRASSRLELE